MRYQFLTPVSKWGPLRRSIGIWLVAFLALGPSLSAATFYVNAVTGDDSRNQAQAQNAATPWKSITRALAAPQVGSGDTVSVAAGVYSVPTTAEVFPLSLKNGVTVIGPQTVPQTASIMGTGTARLFEMRGMDLTPSTRLAYFEMRNFDAISNFSNDLLFFDVLGNTMSPTIDHNKFDGVNGACCRRGIWVDGGDGLPGAFDALIDQNSFVNFYYAIFLEDDYSNATAMRSLSPTISNNTFSNGGFGIYLSASEIQVVGTETAKYSPMITGNTFTNLTDAIGIDISVSTAAGTSKVNVEPTISSNTFNTVGDGIWLYLSTYDVLNSAQIKFAPQIISGNSFTNVSGDGVSIYASLSMSDATQATIGTVISNNTFSSMSSDAVTMSISGYLFDTATLIDNTLVTANSISNTAGGIMVENSIYATAGASANIRPTVSNNTLTGISGTGMSVSGSISLSGTATANYAPTVSGNTLTNIGYLGLSMSVSLSGYGDMTAVTFSPTVSNNTINNAYYGMDLSWSASSFNTSTVNAQVLNNQVLNSQYGGMYLELGNEYTKSANTVLTISGNTVNNSGYDGMSISVSHYGNSGGSNSVTLTNNTVSNNQYKGLTLSISDYNSGPMSQTVLITGNTATGNGGGGIALNFSEMSEILSNDIQVSNNVIMNNGFGPISSATAGDLKPMGLPTAGAGLYVAASGWTVAGVPTNAVLVSCNTVTGNAGDGIVHGYVYSPGPPADFGGGNRGSFGGNKIFGNANGTGLYDFRNNTPAAMGTVKAENNWWGTTDATTIDLHIYDDDENVAKGAVDFTPFQLTARGCVNSAPVANNDTYSTPTGVTLTVPAPGVLANDTDADLDPMTAVLVSGPTNGSLTLNPNGSFSYTPPAAFTGTASFMYRANDGFTNGNIATVTINVINPNSPPVANPDSYSTIQGQTLTVAAPGVLGNDTDAENNPLTAVLQTGPSNGTVTLNSNGSFVYKPNPTFFGTDTFTYRAQDASSSSSPAVVTINVGPQSDLSITKTATVTSVETRAAFQYRIFVANNGPGPSSNVTVTDQLPAGVTVTSTGGDFESCTNSGGVLTCTRSTIGAGNTALLTINVTAPATAGPITNSASVAAVTPDPDSANNSSSVQVRVNSPLPPVCPTGPTALTPPSGATDVPNPARFTWTAVPGATGYTVFGSIDGGPLQEFGSTTGENSTTLQVTLTGSNISWFVRAILTGCPSVDSASSRFGLEEPDSCERHTAANLVAPLNQTVGSIVDYRWTSVLHANGYRVWVSIDGGTFAALNTTQETKFRGVIAKGSVEWFVEALFPGCPSTESAHGRFTVPAATSCNNPPAALLSPANGTTVRNQTVTFTWAAAPNAIGYEVYLSLSSGSPTLIGSTFTETSIQEDIADGEFEWFVRTLYPGCDAVDSARATFVFAQPASCPTQAPITTSPAEAVVGLTSPVDFTWSDTPGAAFYRLTYSVNNGPATTLSTTNTFINDVEIGQTGAVEWFVEAVSEGCRSLESTPATFTVVPPPPPCSTPQTTDMRASANASSGTDYTVRWNPIPNAVSYELQESTNAAFTQGATTTFSVPVTAQTFTHTNPVPGSTLVYYYRARGVNSCNAGRGLFSEPITVGILSIRQADPSPEGSTPIEDPQTTTYQLLICTAAGPACAFVANAGQRFTAATDKPWLTVTPSTGIVPPGGLTLVATALPIGLNPGTNTASVTVVFTSAGSSNNKIPTQSTSSNTTTNVSVNLVAPVSPTPGNTPPPDALIIPAVAHASGVNANFESDIRVSNTSPQPMKYLLTFAPSGETGITEGRQATLDIEPGKTIGLDDVLDSWFGAESSSGAVATGSLEIRPLTKSAASVSSSAQTGLPNIVTFATSRTYSVAGDGSFGTIVPAIPYANFIGKSLNAASPSILSLQNIAQNSTHRTNLGLKEGSGQPATVLVSIFGTGGQQLGQFSQNLTGGQHLQLNSVLAGQNLSNVADARIQVQVTSATGKITSYASVVENANNDASLVSPVALSQAGSAKFVLAGVSDITSGGSGPTRTEVRLFNAGATSVTTSLSVYSTTSTTPITKQLTIAANQVQTLDVGQFFGASNIGDAALHVNSAGNANIIATARTITQSLSGNVGEFFNAVTPSNAVTTGSRPLQILQVEESNRFSTELGIAEVSGKTVDLEISIIPPDSKVAIKAQLSLQPNQFQTLPALLKSAGLDGTYNARVTVKVIGGAGAATAYASVTDKLTGDPIHVPAQ